MNKLLKKIIKPVIIVIFSLLLVFSFSPNKKPGNNHWNQAILLKSTAAPSIPYEQYKAELEHDKEQILNIINNGKFNITDPRVSVVNQIKNAYDAETIGTLQYDFVLPSGINIPTSRYKITTQIHQDSNDFYFKSGSVRMLPVGRVSIKYQHELMSQPITINKEYSLNHFLPTIRHWSETRSEVEKYHLFNSILGPDKGKFVVKDKYAKNINIYEIKREMLDFVFNDGTKNDSLVKQAIELPFKYIYELNDDSTHNFAFKIIAVFSKESRFTDYHELGPKLKVVNYGLTKSTVIDPNGETSYNNFKIATAQWKQMVFTNFVNYLVSTNRYLTAFYEPRAFVRKFYNIPQPRFLMPSEANNNKKSIRILIKKDLQNSNWPYTDSHFKYSDTDYILDEIMPSWISYDLYTVDPSDTSENAGLMIRFHGFGSNDSALTHERKINNTKNFVSNPYSIFKHLKDKATNNVVSNLWLNVFDTVQPKYSNKYIHYTKSLAEYEFKDLYFQVKKEQYPQAMSFNLWKIANDPHYGKKFQISIIKFEPNLTNKTIAFEVDVTFNNETIKIKQTLTDIGIFKSSFNNTNFVYHVKPILKSSEFWNIISYLKQIIVPNHSTILPSEIKDKDIYTVPSLESVATQLDLNVTYDSRVKENDYIYKDRVPEIDFSFIKNSSVYKKELTNDFLQKYNIVLEKFNILFDDAKGSYEFDVKYKVKIEDLEFEFTLDNYNNNIIAPKFKASDLETTTKRKMRTIDEYVAKIRLDITKSRFASRVALSEIVWVTNDNSPAPALLSVENKIFADDVTGALSVESTFRIDDVSKKVTHLEEGFLSLSKMYNDDLKNLKEQILVNVLNKNRIPSLVKANELVYTRKDNKNIAYYFDITPVLTRNDTTGNIDVVLTLKRDKYTLEHTTQVTGFRTTDIQNQLDVDRIKDLILADVANKAKIASLTEDDEIIISRADNRPLTGYNITFTKVANNPDGYLTLEIIIQKQNAQAQKSIKIYGFKSSLALNQNELSQLQSQIKLEVNDLSRLPSAVDDNEIIISKKDGSALPTDVQITKNKQANNQDGSLRVVLTLSKGQDSSTFIQTITGFKTLAIASEELINTLANKIQINVSDKNRLASIVSYNEIEVTTTDGSSINPQILVTKTYIADDIVGKINVDLTLKYNNATFNKKVEITGFTKQDDYDRTQINKLKALLTVNVDNKNQLASQVKENEILISTTDGSTIPTNITISKSLNADDSLATLNVEITLVKNNIREVLPFAIRNFKTINTQITEELNALNDVLKFEVVNRLRVPSSVKKTQIIINTTNNQVISNDINVSLNLIPDDNLGILQIDAILKKGNVSIPKQISLNGFYTTTIQNEHDVQSIIDALQVNVEDKNRIPTLVDDDEIIITSNAKQIPLAYTVNKVFTKNNDLGVIDVQLEISKATATISTQKQITGFWNTEYYDNMVLSNIKNNLEVNIADRQRLASLVKKAEIIVSYKNNVSVPNDVSVTFEFRSSDRTGEVVVDLSIKKDQLIKKTNIVVSGFLTQTAIDIKKIQEFIKNFQMEITKKNLLPSAIVEADLLQSSIDGKPLDTTVGVSHIVSPNDLTGTLSVVTTFTVNNEQIIKQFNFEGFDSLDKQIKEALDKFKAIVEVSSNIDAQKYPSEVKKADIIISTKNNSPIPSDINNIVVLIPSDLDGKLNVIVTFVNRNHSFEIKKEFTGYKVREVNTISIAEKEFDDINIELISTIDKTKTQASSITNAQLKIIGFTKAKVAITKLIPDDIFGTLEVNLLITDSFNTKGITKSIQISGFLTNQDILINSIEKELVELKVKVDKKEAKQSNADTLLLKVKNVENPTKRVNLENRINDLVKYIDAVNKLIRRIYDKIVEIDADVDKPGATLTSLNQRSDQLTKSINSLPENNLRKNLEKRLSDVKVKIDKQLNYLPTGNINQKDLTFYSIIGSLSAAFIIIGVIITWLIIKRKRS